MEHRNTALAALALLLYTLNSVGVVLKVSAFLCVWYFTGGQHWIYIFRNTAARDYRWMFGGVQMMWYLFNFKLKNINVITRFREIVRRAPNKVLYVNATNDEEFTRQQVEEYSNRVTNFFLERGFKKGDTVAVYMPNRPEYIMTWLGLSKIGVIPALVNSNLCKAPLLHTITIVKCKAIVYGLELQTAIDEIRDEILECDKDFGFFHSLRGSGIDPPMASTVQDAVDLDEAIKSCSSKPEPVAIAKSITMMDSLCYIYTSGTTGLPKAVGITHLRQHLPAVCSHTMAGQRNDDVHYSVMPLYHSSGSQLGTGSSMTFGNKTIIKAKFSARIFFKDCAKYKITTANYIGEICRYLLATPTSPDDKNHTLRMMFGNGLRKNIWTEFTNRFGIEKICEFYGATEGNANVGNVDGTPGAIGYIGLSWPNFMREILQPLYIIRVDKVTGDPLRNADGFCIKTDIDEPGEFIGKIVKGDPLKDFNGYKDSSATNKKIVSNVFKQGDMYFRTGDILAMDEFGFLSFKDRTGDTFRWQGENVSTNEVEGIVSRVLELTDMATSYGVEIPDNEGRAGMVAIPVSGDIEIDLEKLHAGCVDQLPKYARPIFVRLVKEVQMTTTFKLQKHDLQQEGFDVEKVKDPLFFLDPRAGKYVKLDRDIYQSIISGAIRL